MLIWRAIQDFFGFFCTLVGKAGRWSWALNEVGLVSGWAYEQISEKLMAENTTTDY